MTTPQTSLCARCLLVRQLAGGAMRYGFFICAGCR